MVVRILSEKVTISMSKNNNKVWNTKYGPRRVRDEAPTLEEAIIAAQSLTDDPAEQVTIAASLMGLPGEQVRAELQKAVPSRKDTSRSFAFVGSPDAPRTVVVERKPSRRGVAAGDRSAVKSTLRAANDRPTPVLRRS
jgi:hypothetical protein